MKHKIVQLMKSEGLSSSRLAEILEIQPSGISHLVSGRNKPGFDLLQKIMRRFPKINPYWLMLDDEQMYLADEPSSHSPTSERIDNSNLADDLFAFQQPECKSILAPQIEEHSNQSESSKIENEKSRLKRVILLYEDGECESYTMR